MRSVLLVFISLIFYGCIPVPYLGPLPTADRPNAEWMVPKLGSIVQPGSPVDIFVSPIEGTNPESGTRFVTYIETDEYYSALLKTLNNSGMVNINNDNDTARYNLITIILQQDYEWFPTDTAILEIQYKLQDTKTKQRMWQQTHESTYKLQYGKNVEKSGGRYHQNNSIIIFEGAARENLSWLIQELSKMLVEEEKKQNQVTR